MGGGYFAVHSPGCWRCVSRRLGGPGHYCDRVLHMKYIVTGSTAKHPLAAAAEFVRQGFYPAHIRRMRQQYQHNLEIFTWPFASISPAGCA